MMSKFAKKIIYDGLIVTECVPRYRLGLQNYGLLLFHPNKNLKWLAYLCEFSFFN
jgi:hypothetical protein